MASRQPLSGGAGDDGGATFLDALAEDFFAAAVVGAVLGAAGVVGVDEGGAAGFTTRGPAFELTSCCRSGARSAHCRPDSPNGQPTPGSRWPNAAVALPIMATESPTDRSAPYPDVSPEPTSPRSSAGFSNTGPRPRRSSRRWHTVPAGPTAADEYVFYDGPPFANGLPHYGHLLTGYVKDVVPRYQTMRGRRVERRFGWDYPWPAGRDGEREGARRLGPAGRSPSTASSNFNEHCRTSVLRYTKEWEDYVTRQARWVDFENDYKTMDLPYMESVMWAFKQL